MKAPLLNTNALTVTYNGLSAVIISEVKISFIETLENSFTTKAIWDTGATNTVITQKVVDVLGLFQTRVIQVNTASEVGKITPTYTIYLNLKEGLTIGALTVSLGVLSDEIGCLIGMDIIMMGDFSITNHSRTVMSFRHPSQHEVDFVEPINRYNAIIAQHMNSNKGMNTKCSCGSGKAFKNCHGINLSKK